MSSITLKRNTYYLWLMIDGKRKGFSLGTTELNQAIRKAKVLEKELKVDLSKTFKLSDLLNLWIDTKFEISENYKYQAETYTVNFIKFCGDLPVKTLTSTHIINYIKHLRKLKYSNTYMGFQLRTVKAIVTWAVINKYLTTNPFLNIPIPQAKQKLEYLSKEEIRMLLKSASRVPLYQLYIEFMLNTGCRGGELQNLHWQDIYDTHIEFRGKTGRRTFPLSKHLKDILHGIKQYNKYQIEHVLISPRTGTPLIAKRAVSYFVKRFLREAGLKDSYTAHSLRHSFASHAVMNGIPIYTVSKLLGHTSVKTTERYSHLLPERLNVDLQFY